MKTIFSGLPQVNANSDAIEIMALGLKTSWGSTLNQHLKPGEEEADEHSSREAEMLIGVLQLRPETMQINDLCGSDYHSYISTCYKSGCSS